MAPPTGLEHPRYARVTPCMNTIILAKARLIGQIALAVQKHRIPLRGHGQYAVRAAKHGGADRRARVTQVQVEQEKRTKEADRGCDLLLLLAPPTGLEPVTP